MRCGEDLTIAADFVLIGIGLVPNTELAEDAGLIIDGGIRSTISAAPMIQIFSPLAIARPMRDHGFLQRKIRLESVPNALEQARSVAATITGKSSPPAAAPWFWSDQYELKLQMVGLSEGYEDLVIRGTTASSSFIAFYLKEGKVIAADAVNRLAEFMAAKRLVGERMSASADALADESISLKSLIAAAVV